jgi:hypothetical protein
MRPDDGFVAESRFVNVDISRYRQFIDMPAIEREARVKMLA